MNFFIFIFSYLLSFVFGLRDGFKSTLPITKNTSIDLFHKYKMRRIREKLILCHTSVYSLLFSRSTMHGRSFSRAYIPFYALVKKIKTQTCHNFCKKKKNKYTDEPIIPILCSCWVKTALQRASWSVRVWLNSPPPPVPKRTAFFLTNQKNAFFVFLEVSSLLHVPPFKVVERHKHRQQYFNGWTGFSKVRTYMAIFLNVYFLICWPRPLERPS